MNLSIKTLNDLAKSLGFADYQDAKQHCNMSAIVADFQVLLALEIDKAPERLLQNYFQRECRAKQIGLDS